MLKNLKIYVKIMRHGFIVKKEEKEIKIIKK